MKCFLKFVLLFSFIQLYLFHECKLVEHNFYLMALKKNTKEQNHKDLVGLNKYEYSLVLDSNPYNENDNYQMIISVSFPVNINIELSPEIIYELFSSKKFCIKDLNNDKQTNIIGKLIEYSSKIKILETIWMKIEEVLFFEEINSIDRKKVYYYLGENDIKKEKKYLFMKKMNKNELNQYYQIIRVVIKDENDQLKNIKIKTEFSVINTDDDVLRDGFTYEVFASDEDGNKLSFHFEKTENLLCYVYKDKINKGECFESQKTNDL